MFWMMEYELKNNTQMTVRAVETQCIASLQCCGAGFNKLKTKNVNMNHENHGSDR
jgi:hypothetical protein